MTQKKKKLENSLKGLFTPKKSGFPLAEQKNQPPEESAQSEDQTSIPQDTSVPARSTQKEEFIGEIGKQEKESKSNDPEIEPVLTQPGKPVVPSQIPTRDNEQKNTTAIIEKVTQENALVTVSEKVEEKSRQILIFKLNDTHFGLEVFRIRTIIKPQPVYPIPGTEEFLKGLINLRGEVVPVFDLRVRFGQDEKPPDTNTRFVVVELGDHLACVIVDAVEGVETIPGSDIEKPVQLVTGVDTQYLDRIAHYKDNLVLILNIQETLKRKQLDPLVDLGVSSVTSQGA
jgi:purine-binding chemotaxis protein CheW